MLKIIYGNLKGFIFCYIISSLPAQLLWSKFSTNWRFIRTNTCTESKTDLPTAELEELRVDNDVCGKMKRQHSKRLKRVQKYRIIEECAICTGNRKFRSRCGFPKAHLSISPHVLDVFDENSRFNFFPEFFADGCQAMPGYVNRAYIYMNVKDVGINIQTPQNSLVCPDCGLSVPV